MTGQGATITGSALTRAGRGGQRGGFGMIGGGRTGVTTAVLALLSAGSLALLGLMGAEEIVDQARGGAGPAGARVERSLSPVVVAPPDAGAAPGPGSAPQRPGQPPGSDGLAPVLTAVLAPIGAEPAVDTPSGAAGTDTPPAGPAGPGPGDSGPVDPAPVDSGAPDPGRVIAEPAAGTGSGGPVFTSIIAPTSKQAKAPVTLQKKAVQKKAKKSHRPGKPEWAGRPDSAGTSDVPGKLARTSTDRAAQPARTAHPSSDGRGPNGRGHAQPAGQHPSQAHHQAAAAPAAAAPAAAARDAAARDAAAPADPADPGSGPGTDVPMPGAAAALVVPGVAHGLAKK